MGLADQMLGSEVLALGMKSEKEKREAMEFRYVAIGVRVQLRPPVMPRSKYNANTNLCKSRTVGEKKQICRGRQGPAILSSYHNLVYSAV